MCTEPLARLNIHNEQFFQVDMDHLQISSFPSRGHPLFQQILTVLNGMLAASKNVQVSEEEATLNEEEREELSDFPGKYAYVY